MSISLSVPSHRLEPALMTSFSQSGNMVVRDWSETGDLLPPLVLIIDDHADSRAIGRLLLENAGFRVLEAATGREGLHVAIDAQPHVVLLDLILPELDGWSLARLLRVNPLTRNTTILCVTALAGADDQDEALLAGCEEILTKPVPPAMLLAAVRRYAACVAATDRRDS